MIVVVRVEEGTTAKATRVNVLGGVDANGNYSGVQALLAAESWLGFTPRILIAPGFTHERISGGITGISVSAGGTGYTTAPTVTISGDGTDAVANAMTGEVRNAVVAELLGIAQRLRAVITADGPSTSDAAAIAYREDWGSDQVYVIDPRALILDTTTGNSAPDWMSPRIAGIITRIDDQRGFWWNPSNNEVFGIVGTERSVDFALGDPNSRANLLNEREVATVIREDGFRLWGNRTTAMDPKYAFPCVRRTADMIAESILRAHLWAVDRAITTTDAHLLPLRGRAAARTRLGQAPVPLIFERRKGVRGFIPERMWAAAHWRSQQKKRIYRVSKTYVEDVSEGVCQYLRSLKARGATLGGDVWLDPELNTPSSIADGRIYFDYDFTPPYPAERVSFRQHLVNKYISEIFN